MLASLNWIALLVSTIVGLGSYLFFVNYIKFLPQNGGGENPRNILPQFIAFIILAFVLYLLMIKSDNHSCMADGLKFGFLLGIGIIFPVFYLSGSKRNMDFNTIAKEAGLYILIITIMGAVSGALN
jgi:thiol:disulfide interchange protein